MWWPPKYVEDDWGECSLTYKNDDYPEEESKEYPDTLAYSTHYDYWGVLTTHKTFYCCQWADRSGPVKMKQVKRKPLERGPIAVLPDGSYCSADAYDEIVARWEEK